MTTDEHEPSRGILERLLLSGEGEVDRDSHQKNWGKIVDRMADRNEILEDYFHRIFSEDYRKWSDGLTEFSESLTEEGWHEMSEKRQFRIITCWFNHKWISLGSGDAEFVAILKGIIREDSR